MRFIYNLLAAVMRWSCDGNGVGTDWLAMKFGDVPWTSGIQLKVDSTWLMIYSVMKKVSLLLLFFMSPNYYIVLSSVDWRISSIVFHVTPKLLILLSGSLRKETFKVFMWYLFSSPSPPKKISRSGWKVKGYLKRKYVYLKRTTARNSIICTILKEKQFVSHSVQFVLGF